MQGKYPFNAVIPLYPRNPRAFAGPPPGPVTGRRSRASGRAPSATVPAEYDISATCPIGHSFLTGPTRLVCLDVRGPGKGSGMSPHCRRKGGSGRPWPLGLASPTHRWPPQPLSSTGRPPAYALSNDDGHNRRTIQSSFRFSRSAGPTRHIRARRTDPGRCAADVPLPHRNQWPVTQVWRPATATLPPPTPAPSRRRADRSRRPAERRPPSSATRYSKACSETLQNRKPALLVSHVPGGHCRGHPPAKSPADLNPHARLTTTPRKPVPRLPGITGNPGHRPRLVGATHDDRKAEFSDVATAAQAAPQDATAGGSHLLGPEQDRQAAGSMPAIDALSPPAFAQIGVERRRPVIRSRAIGLTQDLPARAIAVVRPPTVPLLDALHMLHRSSSTRSLDRRSPTTGRQRLGLPTHRL